MLKLTRCGLVAALLALLPIGVPAAQPVSERLSMELNKVEPVDDVCSLYFVVTNRFESRFDELAADLVMFDGEGIILSRLTVDLGPIRARKTKVVTFPIQSLDCGRLGHILLNEMAACTPPPGESFDCTEVVGISSRSPVGFIK